MNMQQIMMQAQKMQRELKKAKENLANQEFKLSKNGMVEIVMYGDKTIKAINIDQDAFDIDNKEMIEESIGMCINELIEQIDETEDRLKRVAAEFDNYKKRNTKERDGLYNSLIADIVSNFLPILDNLEKAVEAETKDEEYKKGIDLVLKQFKDVLSSKGVTEIETIGKTFDPELHEAVSSVQDATKGEKEIVQEYRKGYMIGNRVIRHSMVIVAN